jgi:hypothetical protein
MAEIKDECLDKETFQILSSKLNVDPFGIKNIWFYDVEQRACTSISSECIESSSVNRFTSLNECNTNCLPNVNAIQTQS